MVFFAAGVIAAMPFFFKSRVNGLNRVVGTLKAVEQRLGSLVDKIFDFMPIALRAV